MKLINLEARYGGIMNIEGTGAEGAGGADAAAAAAAAAAGGEPWYKGHGDELVGHYQNKGWDKLTPAEAAKAAASAHREAERYVGVPADQIVRLPKDASDQEGLNALQLRLGRPQAKENYDLTAAKFSDGSAPDNGFADTIKELAFRSGLSNDRAVELAQGLVKYQEGQRTNDLATRTAQLEADRAGLKTDWGSNYDALKVVAENAAKTLLAQSGLKPEEAAAAVNALEGQTGYKAVMKLFAAIGNKMGEDKFVTNLDPAAPGVLSREQAVARKSELMNDQAWTKRYLDGGVPEGAQMKALLRIITGEDDSLYTAA